MELFDILIVDDDRNTARAILAVCSTLYNIDVADSAEEALRILAERDFKVILSDHKLPQMTGVGLLTKAATIRPEAVRVLMTGVEDIKVVIDAINNAKIYHYLTKPITPDDLLQVMSDATSAYDNAHPCQDDRRRYTTPFGLL